MYMTFFARSPCVKRVSFRRNLATLLPEPSESRKAWASRACFSLSSVLDLAVLGHGRGARACMALTPADHGLTAIDLFITLPSRNRFRVCLHRFLCDKLRLKCRDE